ncbi:MAG: hypothetical protein ABIN96_15165, partial [Rubrivivax sp.]
ITSLVRAYAGAQHAHRVLTEDVRFLEPAARARVLDKERGVVRGFASAVAVLRPDLQTADHQTHLAKPLTMLLFGMVNWMFTWMKPGGALDHEAIAPLVADLFIGGLGALRAPPSQPRTQAIVAPARRRPTPAPTPVSRKIRSQPKETSA